VLTINCDVDILELCVVLVGGKFDDALELAGIGGEELISDGWLAGNILELESDKPG
jgi:hypothetical protein